MSALTRNLSPARRLIRAIRSAAAAAAALALPVTALALAGGAGTASAAARPAITANFVVRHILTLLNGWQSSDGMYQTGDPAWGVSNGVVYLSGSAYQPTAGSSLVAVLPPAARPRHAIRVPVYTFNGTSGHLEILPDGDITAGSTPPASAREYTSLAGISFQVAHAPTHALTLMHGWKPSLAMDGKPAYSVRGGVVHLSGALQQHTGSSNMIAVLPKAARPAHVTDVAISTGDFATGLLRVEPSGQMFVTGGPARSFASLGGVSWPAATSGTSKLALINGWASGQLRYSTGDPAYSVAHGVVYLSGSLVQPGAGSDQFAVLPPAVWPSHYLYIEVYTLAGFVGTIEIAPNGAILAYSPTAGGARRFTSLAAISYPLDPPNRRP